MTSGRPRRLLGPTVGSAVVLAVCGLLLWAVALWTSWSGDCPGATRLDGGLDKGISVWPPAAQCASGHGGTFWHQTLPWAPWVIGALFLGAATVLLLGLATAIRDLRRPAPAAIPRAIVLAPAPGAGGGPHGHAARGQAVEAGERDPPAMAA